jgi:ketol-acid reductoisomerase
MAKVYYEADGDLKTFAGKTIAIIGYGSQGHAHALNLRDSGLKVIVGELPGSPPFAKAKEAGFEVCDAAEAARRGDLLALLVPDPVQAKIYKGQVEPQLGPGKALLFAHGFNIHYKFIVPPPTVDVIMIAPKCPGHRMRELFVEGVGVPGLLAVEQDASGQAEKLGLAYGKGVGCLKAGVIRTTFKEETETDLFGEQAVLCGGVTALVKAAFETLVEAGYQPELAYFECLHELKLIVDLMYRGGMNYMRYSVSDTAEHGDYTAGPKIVTEETRYAMSQILKDIQDGTYARGWIEENQNGRPWFNEQRRKEQEHMIEKVGASLREMMPFVNPVTIKPGE